MGAKTLVKEQIDAGASFLREFNEYAPVAVACWVFPSETDSSYLYIASDAFNDAGLYDGYTEVVRRLHGKQTPWLNTFHIKLIRTSERLARDALAFRDRFPVTVGIPYDGTSIGGIEIDGAYVYPPVAALQSVA